MMKKVFCLFLLLIGLFVSASLKTYASEAEITGPDIIYKQADRILVLSQILPLYSSASGSVTVKSDTYTGNGNIPGNYAITLEVESAGIEKQIEVRVRNTLGQVIAVTVTNDTYTIHLFKNNVLSKEEIIDVLVRSQKLIVTSGTGFVYVTDSYTENANSPGVYVFEFQMLTTSGIEEHHIINISVQNSDELVPDYTPAPSSYSFNIYLILIPLGVIVVIILISIFISPNKKGGRR